MRKAALRALVLGVAALCAAGGAAAQPLQPKRIVVVVPFPPGGPTDVLGRLVAKELQQTLNVSVIVDNRSGASATVGSNHVARATPDGNVLLFNATHHVTNPVFFKRLPYDTRRDFAPLALIATIPSVLVVHPSVPARSTQELIDRAKKAPGKYSMATFGGANQLAGELFKSMADITMENIGYSGEAPAVTAVLGGHVPLMFDTLTTVLPHIESAKLRALSVTGAKRSVQLPGIPTVAESGLVGYEAVAWFGLFMPSGNTQIATKLSQTMSEILGSAETQKRLLVLGADPSTLTGAAFTKFVEHELTKWMEVGEKAKIEKQ